MIPLSFSYSSHLPQVHAWGPAVCFGYSHAVLGRVSESHSLQLPLLLFLRPCPAVHYLLSLYHVAFYSEPAQTAPLHIVHLLNTLLYLCIADLMAFSTAGSWYAVLQIQAQLNITSDALPASESDICDSWTGGLNTSPGYGDVIALPARKVYVNCTNFHTNSQAYSCSSNPDLSSMSITNFCSTSMLDPVSGLALSRLMLQAGVQDGLGQVVTAGEHN